jgi:WD40 repeat protein
LWGLATHPKKPYFVTGGKDKSLRLWNSTERKLLKHIVIDDEIVCVDLGEELIAVGCESGKVCKKKLWEIKLLGCVVFSSI